MRLTTADVAMDEGNHFFATGIQTGPGNLSSRHFRRGKRQSFTPLLTRLHPMVSR